MADMKQDKIVQAQQWTAPTLRILDRDDPLVRAAAAKNPRLRQALLDGAAKTS